MIIDGSFIINAPVEEVWAYLVDIERMSGCLPGVENVERTDAENYSGAVTVRVGPIATSFQGTVALTVQEPPRLLKAKLQGRDRKTSSMVTGEFTSELAPVDQGTEIQYKFDIAIRGRLGQFGQAVILDTSRQLTDEFVNCLRARIERPDDPVEDSAPDVNLLAIGSRSFLHNLRLQLARLWARLVGS
jgi:carbon monoxide dehydrogenase subunit G